jgi:hypothetical protein
MQKTCKIWVGWFALIFMAIGIISYVYFCALGTQGIFQKKISDCTNNLVESYIQFPSCHGFQIILDPGFDAKLEKDLRSICPFSGHFSIFSNKTEIAEFKISSNNSEIRSGRKKTSSLVYCLAGFPDKDFQTNSPLQLLQAHGIYHVKLSFDVVPPQSSSIWLYWTGSIYANKKSEEP